MEDEKWFDILWIFNIDILIFFNIKYQFYFRILLWYKFYFTIQLCNEILLEQIWFIVSWVENFIVQVDYQIEIV